jgi:hypothetical protein
MHKFVILRGFITNELSKLQYDKRILYVSSEVVPYLAEKGSLMSYDAKNETIKGKLDFYA